MKIQRIISFFIAILSMAAIAVLILNKKSLPCIAWEEQDVITYPNIVFMNEHPILAFTPVRTKQQVCVKRQAK